jgi:copper chaperone NosL
MRTTAITLRRWGALVIALLLLALAGCEKKQGASSGAQALAAKPPGTAECAACSMVVREQPAPRAQIVHRDGTRRFLCSIGDLLQYLRAPSKHGTVKAVFVEVLDPKQDPTRVSAAARPWARAENAHFVVGVKRSGVMGVPVLAYGSKGDAARVAAAHGAQVVDYAHLGAAVGKARRHRAH